MLRGNLPNKNCQSKARALMGHQWRMSLTSKTAKQLLPCPQTTGLNQIQVRCSQNIIKCVEIMVGAPEVWHCFSRGSVMFLCEGRGGLSTSKPCKNRIKCDFQIYRHFSSDGVLRTRPYGPMISNSVILCDSDVGSFYARNQVRRSCDKASRRTLSWSM